MQLKFVSQNPLSNTSQFLINHHNRIHHSNYDTVRDFLDSDKVRGKVGGRGRGKDW